MKKNILLITVLAFACLPLMAGNGNTNGTNDKSAAVELSCAPTTVDPYAASLDVLTPGPGCRGPKHPQLVCTAQYDPVCGCDGNTYSNACVAEREGILVFTPGACGSQPAATSCFDPSVVDPTRVCFAVYDPVCACGLLTFPNACEASRLGFVNTTPGACATAPTPGQ